MIGNFTHSSGDRRKNDRSPNILLSNLRSINNKFDDLQCQVLTLNPDVIVCTETWLDSNTPSEAINICGYDINRTDRLGESGRGGVAVWTKRYLRAKKLAFTTFDKTEMCCVQIPSMNILIIGIYLPPGIVSSVFMTICEISTETLDNILIDFSHHKLIVAGDFMIVRF